MSELKPCPFCGTSDVGQDHMTGGPYWIECVNLDCEASGPMRLKKAEAIKAWNTRAGEPTGSTANEVSQGGGDDEAEVEE